MKEKINQKRTDKKNKERKKKKKQTPKQRKFFLKGNSNYRFDPDPKTVHRTSLGSYRYLYVANMKF